MKTEFRALTVFNEYRLRPPQRYSLARRLTRHGCENSESLREYFRKYPEKNRKSPGKYGKIPEIKRLKIEKRSHKCQREYRIGPEVTERKKEFRGNNEENNAVFVRDRRDRVMDTEWRDTIATVWLTTNI